MAERIGTVPGVSLPSNLQNLSLANQVGDYMKSTNFRNGLTDSFREATSNGIDLPDLGVPNLETPTPQGFGDLGAMDLASLGLAGFGAFMDFQNMQLQKDKFKFTKRDRNQQIANQAKTTNLGLANQATMAGQLLGGHAAGSQGLAQFKADNTVQVDGSPI